MMCSHGCVHRKMQTFKELWGLMDLFVCHLSYVTLTTTLQSEESESSSPQVTHWYRACPCATENERKMVAGCSWAIEDKPRRWQGPEPECIEGNGRAVHRVPGLLRKIDGFHLKEPRDSVSDMVHPCQCCLKAYQGSSRTRSQLECPPGWTTCHKAPHCSQMTQWAPYCVAWFLVLY